jgi:hypothetical protein
MITGNLRVIFFLAVLITSELELVHGYFSPENRYLPPTLGSTSVSPTFEIQPFELHDGSSLATTGISQQRRFQGSSNLVQDWFFKAGQEQQLHIVRHNSTCSNL